MANTTNFNWETPDDTDLVKDGAAAIRTLGSAIDTSLVDLKGGTTGQILSKATNTDMDFTWITNDVGDITEIVAGTGLSGGGSSGSITLTNTVATAIDAKGDLVVGTGADTFAKLTVGANNTVLTADSSTATGLKWAAAAAGGKVLQVVSSVKTDTASSTSTSLTGTGVSASITPATTGSKILVLVSFSLSGNPSGMQGFFGLYRGATQIFKGDASGSRFVCSGTTQIYNSNYVDSNSITFLDDPSTTSSTTYELYYRTENSSFPVYLNRSQQDADANYAPRTASSITLLEIGA